MPNDLFSNIITAFVLFAIFAIIYCRVTKKTITELIKELLGIFDE